MKILYTDIAYTACLLVGLWVYGCHICTEILPYIAKTMTFWISQLHLHLKLDHPHLLIHLWNRYIQHILNIKIVWYFSVSSSVKVCTSYHPLFTTKVIIIVLCRSGSLYWTVTICLGVFPRGHIINTLKYWVKYKTPCF